MLEINGKYVRNKSRKVNKEFHSTFAMLAVTVISIMLAFYGIAVITLAGQAQKVKETAQTCDNEAQASRANAISYLGQTDNAIRDFAYTTEPTLASANWSIPMDQQDNLQMIFDKFYVPSNDVVTSDISSILGNYTEGLQMDQSVRDWLSQNNVTYFVGDYVPAIINLDDLIRVFYEQFPTPPATENQSQIIVFVSNNFSNVQPFLNWFHDYQSFYRTTSDAQSRINIAINGISQAYSDAATMDSQDIKQLQQENVNDSWTGAIQSMNDIMAYHKALSTYYPSVFQSFDNIFLLGNNASTSISQYDTYVGQYNDSVEQYIALHDLTFSGNWLNSFVAMIGFGVVMPMSLLGLTNWYQPKLNRRKRLWNVYYLFVIISILGFAIALFSATNTLWQQIQRIFPLWP